MKITVFSLCKNKFTKYTKATIGVDFIIETNGIKNSYTVFERVHIKAITKLKINAINIPNSILPREDRTMR